MHIARLFIDCNTRTFPLAGMLLMPTIGTLYDRYGNRVVGAGVGCVIFAVAWLALTLGADVSRGGMLPPHLAWVSQAVSILFRYVL